MLPTAAGTPAAAPRALAAQAGLTPVLFAPEPAARAAKPIGGRVMLLALALSASIGILAATHGREAAGWGGQLLARATQGR